MGEVIRLKLEGPDAEPGRIPASDVVRLLQGYERALGRAAEARIRRQARIGRRGGAVETATRLIFRGIERGSLVAELELPEVSHGEGLDLDDDHLGELATEEVLALIDDPDRAAGDDRIVDALAQLGDDLGIGSRYSALVVEWKRDTAANSRRATFTGATHERLIARRASAAQRQARDDRVVGTLVEADFEHRTAHIRTSDNQRLEVRFGEEQADEIQAALRRPSELEGRIVYDPRTDSVVSVELRRIVRSEQLQALLEVEDFWRHRTVDDLASEQGVGPIRDLDALVDRDLTDEEISAFLDALAS